MKNQKMDGDPYVNAKGVLINKLNIGEQQTLDIAEAQIAAVAMAALQEEIDKGLLAPKWSFDDFLFVHQKIFGNVYAWAGQPRTVNIEKNGMGYAPLGRISSAAHKLFSNQKKIKWHTLPQNEFAEKMAHFLGEIYAIHPFREGNSRTTRFYVRWMARSFGFELDLQNLPRDEWMMAVGNHFNGSPTLLRNIMASRIKKAPLANSKPPALALPVQPHDPFAGILPPAKSNHRAVKKSDKNN